MNWLQYGCTELSFRSNEGKYNHTEHAKKRQEFLSKCDLGNGEIPCWPFVHNVVNLEYYSDFRKNAIDEFDPLVIPLVKHLNTIPCLQTISSCQGGANSSPSIFFYANEEAAYQILKMFDEWHKEISEDWYWNNVVVSISGKRKKGDEWKTVWHLWLYDTLALIKFTKEYLKIPVKKQIINDNVSVRFKSWILRNQIPVAKIEEIEELIQTNPIGV